MAEADIKVNTHVILTADIRPGDRVLVPMDGRMSQASVAIATRMLETEFPGVIFRFIEGTQLNHALVYRDEVAPASGLRHDQ